MGIHERAYYRDENFESRLAPTWSVSGAVEKLVIANVIVFLAEILFSTRTFSLQAFLSISTDDLRQPWMLWRSLTYGFTHDMQSVFHVAMNMFTLYMLGRVVEDRYGSAEFLRAYLASIVLCGLLYVGLHWITQDPARVCGASGGVSFVIALFVLNFPRRILLVFGVIPVQAWVVGVFLLITNILGAGGARGASGTQVAWDAHLIGAALAGLYFYSKVSFRFFDSPARAISSVRRKLFGPKLKTYREEPDVEIPGDWGTEEDREEARQAAIERNEEMEADRILDKIHRLGQDALSKQEKKFMQQYSERVRNKRKR
jgi:membrane associated rhomboid family serine protease